MTDWLPNVSVVIDAMRPLDPCSKSSKRRRLYQRMSSYSSETVIASCAAQNIPSVFDGLSSGA